MISSKRSPSRSSASDVAVIPPGHDAWVVGDEPNVLLELSAPAG